MHILRCSMTTANCNCKYEPQQWLTRRREPPSSSDSSVCEDKTLVLLVSVKDAADVVDLDVPVPPVTTEATGRFLPTATRLGGLSSS